MANFVNWSTSMQQGPGPSGFLSAGAGAIMGAVLGVIVGVFTALSIVVGVLIGAIAGFLATLPSRSRR